MPLGTTGGTNIQYDQTNNRGGVYRKGLGFELVMKQGMLTLEVFDGANGVAEGSFTFVAGSRFAQLGQFRVTQFLVL